MVRNGLFFVGFCLALTSAIYSAQPPIAAARFMMTLREVDGRVLLLMLPFALAAAASAASAIAGWKLRRTGRTLAVIVVLLGGAVLPLLAAPLGHAAMCSVACKPGIG